VYPKKPAESAIADGQPTVKNYSTWHMATTDELLTNFSPHNHDKKY